ncbi:DUF3857 domain-containing protein [Salegentibacter maritimus]|uniref:DUF3857 domain-containing protein n=1 Tax=Salegentibacter maritimus TaxID=2794347 RepID=A0ABS0TKJ8_9FLAO|nr:DUF3857 domain-containing protein [Salegentibacter maritimus]MBI6121167.1 DUF3857 domain-containing protein [Salegentibacter maritimus]
MRNLLFISLLLSQFVFSQKKDLEFGVISDSEIEMKYYEKDKEAKAVVLYDKGESIFFDIDNGYNIQFKRHKRIKIFDKSESQHAEIAIPFYVDGFGKTEIIKSIKAFTYNTTNGKLTRKALSPSNIYEERINDRWRHKKFVFPDVQDGAILEYRYILETPFHFNLPDWQFQDKIPTLYSEYQVSMIPFYEYVFIAQGVNDFDYQNSVKGKTKRSWGSINKSYGKNIGSGIEFQDYIHTYVLTDIPAFTDESYISSINDYIIKMDFQLAKFHSPRGGTTDIISTWPELNESLLKNEKFGKYIKKSSRLAKKILLEEINFTGNTSSQKAKDIIEYVKNNFEWNGEYGKYASQDVKDFFNSKRGNVADINLFMIGLLNEAEIKTKPIILSTRNHGKISTGYPFDHFTNYVVALVESDYSFLADGTEDLLSYNKLPTRCNNEIGLIVEKEATPKWISLKNNFPSKERNTITMILDTVTQDVKAQVSIKNTEYESYAAKKRFKNDSVEIRKFYEDKIGDIKRSRTNGYKRNDFPYSMLFETKYETEKLGNNIVIMPFLNLPLSKNSLTQKERTYPVDFVYPWENQFRSSLEVPKNYSVLDMPKDYKVDNGLVEIQLKYSLTDNTLFAQGSYKFKKSIYLAKEYAQIKNSLDEIVKYFNQPVVLEKNEDAIE